MKIWILFLCAVAVGVTANNDDSDLPAYWDDDYTDQWYRGELEKLGIVEPEEKDASEDDNNFNDYDNIANVGNQEKSLDEIDKKVEKDIQEFEKNESEGEDDAINDYQFEDNRSDPIEKVVDNNEESDEKADLIREVDDLMNLFDDVSANNNNYDDYGVKPDDIDELSEHSDNLPNGEETDDKEIQLSKDDDIVPLPMPPQSSDEINEILEETKAILNEEEQQPNDFASENENENEDKRDNIKEIVADSKKIIEETNIQFDEEDKIYELDKPVENIPDKAIEEKIDDELEKKIDENLSDNIADNDEDTVDKVYEDLNEDLDTLFETLSKLANSENKEDELKPADVDYAINSDESLDEKADYKNIFDSNLSDIFSDHSKAEKKSSDADLKEDNDEPAEKVEQKEPVLYVNDALVSEDEKNNDLNDVDESIKSVSVDQLTDDQIIKLMEDFAVQHSDVFDVKPASENDIVNEINIKYGETKVITTENYPAAYPTNRIVDWIITGEGVGIEFNVTDFAVNGALGDYLLVKPGQPDDSGSEGLLFSYHLNKPRAYRFMDVDRMFLRFDSKNGFSFLRGFSLTISMIAPLPSEPEPIPEPEAVLPEPRSTLTVILGGLTLQEFKEIREDFRLLIADMATMYINANGIDPGINTTAQITQIISASVCNVHWPGYEQCAHVRLAVPLVYEDELEGEGQLNEDDLETMWDEYVDQDPFASRLRQMGIEEFSVPNDSGVLTVWLVVALGVLVSAAMMAFALWRYTCFKDYSRMPVFSDTDSINEKRGLDLYPTPHQTLPPLYAENDYKWDNYADSTRVDMGGFTNRSYVRNDMYDLDSDEDVVAPRDRSAGIQPRDVYNV